MRTPTIVLAAVLLLLLAPTASAQFGFGAQANYADDFDFGIGGRVLYDTTPFLESTRAVASFDLYFPDEGGDAVDVSFWEINVNGHYFFPIENSPVRVYAGAGLHFASVSIETEAVTVGGIVFDGGDADDSEVGLNILGGVEFPIEAAITPFAELKIELGGAEQFVITGGVNF